MLHTVLERFANEEGMDVVLDAANALIGDAKRDRGLCEWSSSVDGYVRKVRTSPLTVSANER